MELTETKENGRNLPQKKRMPSPDRNAPVREIPLVDRIKTEEETVAEEGGDWGGLLGRRLGVRARVRLGREGEGEGELRLRLRLRLRVAVGFRARARARARVRVVGGGLEAVAQVALAQRA